jgi:hypothetical protein
MTQTAMVAGDTQRLNFFNIFVGSQKSVAPQDSLELLSSKTKKENILLDWLQKSDVFMPVEFKTIQAGEIFQTDLLIVKFTLSDRYSDHFVLLRGLLEFSRPIKISISSNRSEKTFQLHIAEDKAEIVLSYLDTIQGLFINELKFKKSLKAVLRFEREVRHEQAKLYEELRASVR